MQLYILGKNSDDKGTQLEQLAKKILEHQGLKDIATNIQGAGGNEIDITAYSQTTIGICPQKTKVIGECKAHKAPINITDWLKFIGKVHYAREMETNVIGIMVCLSGANGAVVGMYNERHHNDNTIQLIANRDLINLISDCFDIEAEAKVREKHASMSYGDIDEMNLLYYDRKIYWVTSFIDGKYTISNAKGNILTKEEVDVILPLLMNHTPYSADNYINISEHAEHQQILKSINVAVLTTLITGKGNTLDDIVKHIYDSKSKKLISSDLLEAALEQNPFITYNKDTSIVTIKDDTEIDIVDFYRYVMSSECPLDLIISDFYQQHINENLVEKIQNIQCGIELPKEKLNDCIFLLRHSPRALFRAITPNSLFHAYEAVKSQENMKALYVSYFVKMLTDSFVEDVKEQSLSSMYDDYFKINKIRVSSNIEIEVDGEKRSFDSYTNFLLAKLHGYNQSIVCISVE